MSWPILTQDDLTTDNRDMAVGDITFTDILIEEKVHVSDEYLPKVDTSLKDGRHKNGPHLPTMLYHQPLTNGQVGG